MTSVESLIVNGRQYRWPRRPTVVICCDGSEPAYIEGAIAAGLMPNLQGMLARGEDLRGDSVIPSFTNPNNLSILTGRPPAVHGISGNFFFDRDRDEAVMMNDPKFLRAPTIFQAFYEHGARVAVVTAKDKLRTLLGHGLRFDEGRAICFSSERADQAALPTHGITGVLEFVGMPLPNVYSLELSEFVFAAGVRLLETMKPDLMYLSTTDFIQHKYAPGSAGADAFYVAMDRYLGALDRSGATVLLTADHGMKDKHHGGGEPDVLYLQDMLDECYGRDKTRVILPITDPYVVHHGALGSFATVYVDPGIDQGQLIDRLRALPKISHVLDRRSGCALFELPEDRLGDVIVVSQDTKVIGTRKDEHDLSALTEPLRSHGGISEQRIPIIVNRKLVEPPRMLRNFDAFSLALNHAS
jgi:phosphonoacetate hydrolase